MTDLSSLAAFAEELVDAAGAVVRRYYRQPIRVDHKHDESPVTIADREAERVMREMITRRFPEHGIDGEEFGQERLNAQFVWSLDPIDGTKSFIAGRPLFGTLVSLLEHGKPVIGVIDQCILGERWVGVAGRTTTWNSEPIHVRACPDLADAVLFATSPHMFAGAERTAFDRVAERVRQPMYGGDCYAYGLLALGFADLVVEADLNAYDFTALVPVIEGAGGVISDWNGASLSLTSAARSAGRVLAAGDAAVHVQARALLKLT